MQHVLAFFSKVHDFLQNSVFSARSAGTVIFALGAPFLTLFSKVHEFVQRANTTYQRLSTKCTSFYKTAFSALDSACFVIFTLGTPLLRVFSKVHKFVQNSVFSRRSARFNIFALGGPLFSDFQQRASAFPAQDQNVSSFLHWAHHF